MTRSLSAPFAHRARIALMIAIGAMTAAPTVGDIGSCGGVVEPLDATKYFTARAADECARCRSCGLTSRACGRSCDTKTERLNVFPPGCRPVARDGEVCLRALAALSCEAFADVASDSPIVPTECDFCPAELAK